MALSSRERRDSQGEVRYILGEGFSWDGDRTEI